MSEITKPIMLDETGKEMVTAMDKIAEILIKNGGSGGGGGGASTWADLGESTTYGDTLTWDGNTDGLECLLGVYFKVSDSTPTIEDVANYKMAWFGEDGFMDSTTFPPVEDFGILLGGDGAVIIANDMSEDGLVVTKGIYFLKDGDVGCQSLTIPNYQFEKTEITPVPSKYLPKALQFGEFAFDSRLADNTVYPYDAEYEAYAMDFVLEKDCVYDITINEKKLGKVSSVAVTMDGYEWIYVGNPALQGIGENTGEPYIILFAPAFDMCMAAVSGITGDMTLTVDKYTLTKLNPAYCEKSYEMVYFNPDNDDRYIYKDSALSQKLTGEELKVIAESKQIRIAITALAGLYFQPIAVQVFNDASLGEHGMISFYLTANGASPVFKTLVTAEYTG